MDFSEGSALEIVERLCSAYGVTTQKALAECLGVPAANVSNWVQRDSVPGSAFVKCALDTECDLSWLAIGKFANSSFASNSSRIQGKDLYNLIGSSGGRAVLNRIMESYGFTLQKQLCEKIGISSGTVSTWIRRNYFPGDVVVACAIETGVPLEWLATGKVYNSLNEQNKNGMPSIPRKELNAGLLVNTGFWGVDLKSLKYDIKKPLLVTNGINSWVIDESITNVSNGRWLLSIDGKHDIYDVAILPRGKINLSSNHSVFSCSTDEVFVSGKVIITFDYNI